MALPIKETPVLKGKDAQRFSENMRTAESRPVPREDYERAKNVYQKTKNNQEHGF